MGAKHLAPQKIINVYAYIHCPHVQCILKKIRCTLILLYTAQVMIYDDSNGFEYLIIVAHRAFAKKEAR